MYFVDKQHVVGFERSENTCQITRLIEHRTACYLEAYTQFIGNNVAQRGLS